MSRLWQGDENWSYCQMKKKAKPYKYNPPMRNRVVSRTTLRMYVRKNVLTKIRGLAARVKKLERALARLARSR
jgi:hypothetical protein